MTTRIEIQGLRDAIERLGALPPEVKKAARTSLNRQATATRKNDLVAPAMAATGLPRAVLNARLPISKAGSNDLKSKIKANSAGIPVPAFTWRWQRVPQQIQFTVGPSPTRARIYIHWPGGEKIASGFVNPLGQYRAPLSTRIKGHDLAIALAPSAAALKKELYQESQRQGTQTELAARFVELLEEVVNRRPVPSE